MEVQPADVRALVDRHRPEWPSNSYLARLDTLALRDLVNAGDVVRFRRGDAIIDEGAVDTDVFLLVSAVVKVTASLGEGRSALLAIRVGGDVVGEIGAVDVGRRSATVRACGHDPVIAVSLRRIDFRGVLDRHPQAAMSLASVIGRKLRAATRRRVDYVNCEPRVRLARVLVELAEDYGREAPVQGTGILIPIDLTRTELGTLVGASEKTARRAYSGLQGADLIGGSRSRMLIPDINALRSVAYPEAPANPAI